MRRLLRLLHYVRPYWLQLIASVILMAIVGLLEAVRILLVKPIFDRALAPTPHGRGIDLMRIPFTNHVVSLQDFVPARFQNDWTMVAYALVATTLIKGVCDYLGTYLVNYAGFGMITDLRNALYNTILRRSVGFFGQHSTGSLLSTIINDIERIQFAMSTVLGEFMQQFFTMIFTVIAVIALGGKFAWILLLFIPFIVLSAKKIGGRVRHTTRKGQEKLADIQHILHETITGNRIVKAFNMENWEIARFRGAARKLFRANMRSVRAQAISSPLMDVIGAAAVALLLLLGRDKIKDGSFTLGGFITFVYAVFSLYVPVRKFAGFNNNFQQALGASDEIFHFMDSQDDVKQRAGAAELKAFKGSIRFENVTFSYPDELGVPQQILKGINLEIKAGDVVAFVGSSGAGKSTLANLVPRFFDVDGTYDGNGSGGRILIDGQDVRDLTLSSLRAQIGIVTQDTILFNDTVRNNIAYGQPGVEAKRVEAAAIAANAHDFIMRMPNGYDSVIGERGTRLSGGERQRIAIARALLKNAPILILDEATSSLDTESESLVQAALQRLMENRTVLIIAHRLTTVRNATRIVVLEKGKIAEEGPHDELVTRLGTYKRLYDLQFVDIN